MKERVKVLTAVLMILSISLSVISCSKDDENSSIVGTWKFKSAVAGEVKTNSAVNDEKIKANIPLLANKENSGATIVFKADGTYQALSRQEEGVINGTYTFSKGILTVKFDDETVSNKITLNNETFVMESDYTYVYEDFRPVELKELGIIDPTFKITKATGILTFSREK